MLKSIFPFKRFTKRISASKDNAKRFFGGEEDTSNVSSNPLNSNRNIDGVKRKSSVLESVATSQSGFGKATGFDVLNFFGNKKIARRLRKSVNRLKDALVQTFTVSKALRASVSNIFGQVKGLFGSTGGKLALGAALAGLAFFLFEKVIKPSLNVVVNWINSTGESIVNAINSIITLVEDISNTVNNVLKFLKLAPEDSEVKLDRLEAPKIELPEFLKTEEQKEKERKEKEEKEQKEKEQKEKEARVEVNKEARTAKPSEFVDDIKSEKPGGFFSGIAKSLGNFFRGNNKKSRENNKKSNTTSETPMMGSGSTSETPMMGSGSTSVSLPKEVADDKPFQQGVSKLAKKYNVSEDDLYAVMSFETGGTFDPAKKNEAGSGATGLIQFMPETAKGLGTSTEELSKMSRTQQLKYVDKYFSNKGIQGGDIDDLYMSILFPAAVGKPDDFVLFGRGAMRGYTGRAYDQNRGLDANNDGSITKAEAAAKVRTHKRQSAVKLEPNKTQPKNLKTNPKSNNTSFINLAPSSTPTAPAPRPTQQISNSSGSSGSGPTIAFYSPSNPDPISFTGINYGAVG